MYTKRSKAKPNIISLQQIGPGINLEYLSPGKGAVPYEMINTFDSVLIFFSLISFIQIY